MQVATYSLARPAREVLFTVISREEKYKVGAASCLQASQLATPLDTSVIGALRLRASNMGSRCSLACWPATIDSRRTQSVNMAL